MKTTIDKKELIDWIEGLDNEALLVTLQSMKNNTSDSDFWDEIPEEAKQAITTAKNQLKEGKGIPHEEVMQEIQQKFSR